MNDMTFFDAIRSVFINYFNFKGRAGRKEFWYFFLFDILINITLLCFILYLFPTDAELYPENYNYTEEELSIIDTRSNFFFIFLITFIITNFAFIIPRISIAVRRLHDAGYPGWLVAPLYLILGFIGNLILLILACVGSQPGENKWGANPNEKNEKEKQDEHEYVKSYNRSYDYEYKPNKEKVLLTLTYNKLSILPLFIFFFIFLLMFCLLLPSSSFNHSSILFFTALILIVIILAYKIRQRLKHKKDYIEIAENGISWKYAEETETLSWDKIDSCNVEYRKYGKGADCHFIVTYSGHMQKDFNLNYYHYDLEKLTEAVNTAYKEHRQQKATENKEDIQEENLMDYKEPSTSFKKEAIHIAILIIIYLIFKLLTK